MLMERLLRIMPGSSVLSEGLLGARDICKICIIICYLFTVIAKRKVTPAVRRRGVTNI